MSVVLDACRCSHCTGSKLTELYVRRNQVSDFSEVEHLSALPNLTVSVFYSIYILQCLHLRTSAPVHEQVVCTLLTCVLERERERERERESKINPYSLVAQVVWLSGNPISIEPGYRRNVAKQLKQIKKLDNVGKLCSLLQSTNI